MLARARRTAGATVRPFLRALSDAAVRLPLERNTCASRSPSCACCCAVRHA